MPLQNSVLSQMKLNMLVSAAHELSAGIGSLVRVAELEQVFERLVRALTLMFPELEALISSARTIYISDDDRFREQSYHELLLEFRAVVAEVIVITDSIVELSTSSSAPDVLRSANTLARRARELDLDFAQRSFEHL